MLFGMKGLEGKRRTEVQMRGSNLLMLVRNESGE